MTQSLAMLGRPELWARLDIEPGYDCRGGRCQHDPRGDHGICSETWMYSIADARDRTEAELCVVLTVFSSRYPSTVPKRLQLSNRLATVSRHFFDPGGQACEYLGLRGCGSNTAVLASCAEDDVSFIDFDHPDPTEKLWLGLLRWVDDWQGAKKDAQEQRALNYVMRGGRLR